MNDLDPAVLGITPDGELMVGQTLLHYHILLLCKFQWSIEGLSGKYSLPESPVGVRPGVQRMSRNLRIF